jgi:hypothetical protein
MKPPVADHLKSQGITFSLKPDLYRQLLARVESLGYPWTKSSYITKLVIDDLGKHGLWPIVEKKEKATPEEIDAFIEGRAALNVASRKRRAAARTSSSKNTAARA